MTQNKSWNWTTIVTISALLLAIATCGFLVDKNYHLSHVTNQMADPNQELVADVGQLVTLPQDEQPTIATVSDLAKLKGQAFFNDAAIGDKVLIYANAKKAILYRPSAHKIIAIAPLDMQ